MAKVKRRNADGTVKKKNRKSSNQKQKLSEKDVEKRTKFNNKKAEEQQGKDAMAREAALERLEFRVWFRRPRWDLQLC